MRAVEQAAGRDEAWLEQVRSGLVALLGFLDDEPTWARLLLLEASAAGPRALQCEQRLLGVVTQLLENGDPRTLSEPAPLSHLTAELLAGGTFAVIRARALRESGKTLVELAPSLMAFIVRPYLGEAAARAELEGRPAAASELLESGPYVESDAPVTGFARTRAQAVSRAAELPVRVTRRTTLVLRAIARAPYSNNREVAQAAGLTDEGQASKLLARLQGKGVIENVGVGAARGEPNAWLLTASGRRAVELLGEGLASGTRARRARAGGAR